jgi:sugar phosphate isomerase/epimerase
MANTLLDRLVASPCCNPKMPLEQLLPAYASMGFRKYEVFTTWVESRFDIDRDPSYYRDLLASHGMQAVSLHLPQVNAGDCESLRQAVKGAVFAIALGAPIVLYKADSLDTYAATAREFLDAIDGMPLTPVLQNHSKTCICTAEDFRTVLERVGDTRMKALLEVGHFHAVGVSWREGQELLSDRIRLAHIKDLRDGESVVFGTGEIDYPAFFRYMDSVGYTGDYVMEIEAGGVENTLYMMRESVAYLCGNSGTVEQWNDGMME